MSCDAELLLLLPKESLPRSELVRQQLRNRRLNYGILIATNGITGDASELTAAHSVVAGALREGRRLLVFQRDELLSLEDSGQLVRLVKEKLCDLAVRGSAT